MARKSTDLVVNILGDYDSLKKTLRKASGDLGKFDKTTKQVGKGAGFRNIGKAALGAAAGIGAVTIAANEVKKSVTGTVELAKATRQLQRATGLASEDASQLAAVLKVRGLSTDKVGRSFTTLARQIEAAKKGTGGAADAFRQLGVSQKALQSGNFNQVLLGISDGYKRLGDSTAKASLGQQLFGRNSRDLLPLLEGGSQKLREQLALAPQLSAAQVKQSLAMVNAQRQVDLALMNVRTTLGTTLMPILADGANKLAKFVTEMKTGKGAGGEFARKVKDIFNAAKPAVEQLVKFAKAVFNFAAENPGVVRIAASLAAVGLAIKGIKFVSAISGLSTFLKASKALGGPLRKLFQRFGTQAGGAFAAEASGTAAGNMAGSLAPAGRLGKMRGRFAGWGRLAGRAAGGALAAGIIAGIIAYGPELARKLNDWFSQNVPGFLKGILGIRGSDDPRSGYFGMDKNPFSVGAPKKRSSPMARAQSLTGRAGAALRPTLNAPGFGVRGFGADPFTGGIPVEVLLKRAEGQASRARNTFDRATVRAGDSRTKAETKRLRELEAAAKLAESRVKKLQSQLARRDALMEIRSQFKEFTQSFSEAYAQGLQNVADARLQAAQNLAQKTLDAQLKALDEEQGTSQEAQRLRELRAQQETDAKTREDEDYAKSKLAIETDLARAIRNGNLRGQAELQQQLADLEQTRRDTLRNREIADLSESLSRQRQAAQDEYEAKNTAAQTYYEEQVERNKQIVDDYQRSLDQQIGALRAQFEAGRISYTEFNRLVTEKYAELTTNFNTELTNRQTAETESLRVSLGAVGSYVDNVNAEFARVMRSMPTPQIPAIPAIPVDVLLNAQSIRDQLKSALESGPTSVNVGGQTQPYSGQAASVINFLSKAKTGSKVALSKLRRLYGSDTDFDKFLSSSSVVSILKRRNLKLDRAAASGGRLSRAGLTMVGETGPELVMNGQVFSATRTARMSGSGVTLNVYPQTTADDPVALARALGWQLATR